MIQIARPIMRITAAAISACRVPRRRGGGFRDNGGGVVGRETAGGGVCGNGMPAGGADSRMPRSSACRQRVDSTDRTGQNRPHLMSKVQSGRHFPAKVVADQRGGGGTMWDTGGA